MVFLDILLFYETSTEFGLETHGKNSSRPLGWMFVSNMFPSDSDPSYGVFVARSLEDLQNCGINIKQISVIRGRHSGFHKVIIYIKYFIELIRAGIDPETQAIYVHYASHHCIPILLLNFIFNKKLLVHIHGDDLALRDGITRKILRLGQVQLFERADCIVVPSMFFLEVFEDFFPKLKSKKLYVSPSSGVDVLNFENQPRKDSHYWNKYMDTNTTFQLGYTGRIDSDKGWRLITDAYRLIPKEISTKLHLHFFGHGKEIKDLHSFITSIGEGNATYHGHFTQEDTASIHQIFDFHLIPSSRESLGLAAIEGLAAGNIVICSRIRPFTDFMVNDYSALHFESGDAMALAKTIVRALSMPPRDLTAMSIRARDVAQHFDRKQVASQLATQIRKVYE